jgi:hypothetical protein
MGTWAHGAALTPPVATPEPGVVAAGEELDELKAEFVALKRELVLLEAQLLYPPSSQIVVYVAMRLDNPFQLEALDFYIDGKRGAHYLYTEREVAALLRGGVQRLYLGNIEPGGKKLRAEFKATDAKGRPYKRSTELEFEKAFEPVVVELAITDAQTRSDPEIVATVVR